jgi:hypothetical protein
MCKFSESVVLYQHLFSLRFTISTFFRPNFFSPPFGNTDMQEVKPACLPSRPHTGYAGRSAGMGGFGETTFQDRESAAITLDNEVLDEFKIHAGLKIYAQCPKRKYDKK